MIQKDQSSSLMRMTKTMREGRAAQAISIHLCVCVCVCECLCENVLNESMRVPVCVSALERVLFCLFYLFQSNVQ